MAVQGLGCRVQAQGLSFKVSVDYEPSVPTNKTDMTFNNTFSCTLFSLSRVRGLGSSVFGLRVDLSCTGFLETQSTLWSKDVGL